MTDTATMARPAANAGTEHFDVLIVGAGISGLSAAWHFQNHMPGTSFVALEREASFGGTWLTHKFPGIRSDSDLYTFGFHFKPWVGPPIATAAEIQSYLGEMIAENHLDQHIRYNHEILSADWSDDTATWTVHAKLASGEAKTFTANFLYMAQGYYKHRKGFWPNWDGMDRFKGPILHTEEWDENDRLCRQARHRHRIGRDDRHHRPGNGQDGEKRHHRPALADLFLPGAQCR